MSHLTVTGVAANRLCSLGSSWSASRTWRALASLVLLAAVPVHAQQGYKWESFEDRVDAARKITAIDDTAFGENIGLQTGRLGFTVTDVDLSGNNALPVRFTRSYEVVKRRDTVADRMVGDWEIETPRLSGRFATEWLAGASTNRCSSTAPPNVPADKAHLFNYGDFWQGVRLDIPGITSGELLSSQAGITKPSDGNTYLWTVTDGQTHLSCLSSLANGTGQGFLALTPDGTKYTFNWMAQRPVRGVTERIYDSAGAPSAPVTLDVKENTLYATRVEDRFGNYVDYTYTNAATQPGKLARIESSDGRRIDLEYNAAGDVWKVKAGSTISPAQRTWIYTYGVDASPTQRPTLNSVALPDGSAWTIQFAQLGYSAIFYGAASTVPTETSRTCTALPEWRNGTLPAGNPAPVTLVGSITHPAGATATYTLDIREFSRSEVAVVCNNFNLIGGAIASQEDDTPLYPINWHEWSLTSKVLQGPGLSPQTWTYSYDSDLPTWWFLGPSHPSYGNLPTCPVGTDCSVPRCASASCADRSYTTVQAPDLTKERYSFGNTWQYDEGKLLKVQRGYNPATGAALETVDYTHDLSHGADQAYSKRFGTSQRSRADGFTSEYHRPTLSKITTRDGATFSWAVANDTMCGSVKCFDTLARPTKVSKASSLGFSKTESYAYADNTSKWVMGQLSSTQVNGVAVASAIYDPTYATMTQFSAFGQLQQVLVNDTTSTVASGQRGTVYSVTDANNKTTTLTNWRRGVPQTLGYPTSVSESAVANDFGEIISITDELGNTTCYGRDAMGRVNLVTQPSESSPGTCDTSTWSATSIVFAKVGAAEYNIAAQHWKRTETTNTRIHETYYDGLWRPILTRQRTTDASAGERFVRKTFDHAGRETFSRPTRSPAALQTMTTRCSTRASTRPTTRSGRVTGTTADSELGLLSTSARPTWRAIPRPSTPTRGVRSRRPRTRPSTSRATTRRCRSPRRRAPRAPMHARRLWQADRH
ncbi:MAG: hypothetical protein LKM32_07185 [Chiayiivirga sp.]|uniref:hypothetical protein n=1 Tax=Chiayiivirga sp. TaxID=2041042 RepID=UPI0025C451A6|nr:hypothetical protein [Chiayiivirga sp.]MCI1729158.1 hypothetical protein [Chiayiivirga sp.]